MMENNVVVDEWSMEVDESPCDLTFKEIATGPEENPGLVCNSTFVKNEEESRAEIEDSPLQQIINNSKADESIFDETIKMDLDESFDAVCPNNNPQHQSTLVCDTTFSNNSTLVSSDITLKKSPNCAAIEGRRSFEHIKNSIVEDIFDAACTANNNTEIKGAALDGTFCKSPNNVNNNQLLRAASPFETINNNLNHNETKKTEEIAPANEVHDETITICDTTKNFEEINTSNKEANKTINNSVNSHQNNCEKINTPNKEIFKTNSEAEIVLETTTSKDYEEINISSKEVIKTNDVNSASITNNPEEIITPSLENVTTNTEEMNTSNIGVNKTIDDNINNTIITKHPEEIITSTKEAINTIEVNSEAITTLENVCEEANDVKHINTSNKEIFTTNEVNANVNNPEEVNISHKETNKFNTSLENVNVEAGKAKDIRSLNEVAMESNEPSPVKLIQAAAAKPQGIITDKEGIIQDSLETHKSNNLNETKNIEELITPNEDEIFVSKGNTLSEKLLDSINEDKKSPDIYNKSFKSRKSRNSFKDHQLMEDRSPLQKIKDNSNDFDLQGIVIKVEEPKSPSEVNNYQNKENFNLSIFSDSPAKARPGSKRDSLFRTFDPLYSKSSAVVNSTSYDLLQTQTTETLNEVKSKLICINEFPNASDIALTSCKQIKEDLTDDSDLETFLKALPESLHSFKAKMDDAVDEKMRMEQELTKLKLELNQLQQERTTQQLELHQKDEVILKIQGEAQKMNNQYKLEIKQLQDKLNNINEQNNNEEICKLREREVQLTEKNRKLLDQISSLESSVSHFEKTLNRVMTESEKVRSAHGDTKKHLATLEMSFSDVHAKYERTKEIVIAYKNNEEVLGTKLKEFEESARKYEERYNMLKTHAKGQIDKANRSISDSNDKHQLEMNKMSALLRRLEIKCGSMQQALDQKTKECADLAALCDEWAGSGPQ